MGINLQKGQKIDLTKGNEGLTDLLVGLGWDAAKPAGGGLFNAFKSAPSIDCDVSVLMLGADDKLITEKDVIYFGNLTHKSGAVKHMGDNLTGDGDGDDEQIFINLSKIPANIEKIVFVVNIYNAVVRKQHFGMIKNAFIRILDSKKKTELLRFNLSDNYTDKTALFTGEVYRYNKEWKFAAIGEGTTDKGLKEIIQKYI
ncbi:MAG: TerD family protein [Fusobacteriales bacterium]|jgi:stress response protein SCP2|nr:TerD family protein [Fusobacteriales bacterium]